MKASEKIWWTKLIGAVTVAVLCVVVQVYFSVEGLTAFMMGMLLYIATSDLLARRNGMDPMQGLKIGVGVFLFTWLTVWALIYTVLQTMA